jgi:hypothetical protein
MHFILLPPSFYRKTPSLRLRLRVAQIRSPQFLSGHYPATVRHLSGDCPGFVWYRFVIENADRG